MTAEPIAADRPPEPRQADELPLTTAAAEIGCSERSLRRYRKAGKLAARRLGRQWLVKQAVVDRLKQELRRCAECGGRLPDPPDPGQKLCSERCRQERRRAHARAYERRRAERARQGAAA